MHQTTARPASPPLPVASQDVEGVAKSLGRTRRPCNATDASPESWKCAECLNLTDELYECLASDANLSIRWFCESCDKSVMGNQTDRVEHLFSVVEKLVDRYDDFEKRLESKSSVEAVSMLDDRIKGLEDRLTQFSRSTEEKFVELEKELLHTNEEGDKENEISDEDLIKHVVQEEVNRKKQLKNVIWKTGKEISSSTGCPKRRQTMCQIGKLVMENLLGI